MQHNNNNLDRFQSHPVFRFWLFEITVLVLLAPGIITVGLLENDKS